MLSYFDDLKTPDGAHLRYGIFRSEGAVRRGTMLLLTGRSEFLEKYAEVILDLNHRGWDVFGFDWRGQGLSARMLPNRHKGHIRDYGVYIGDLDLFLRRVVIPDAARPLAGLAHSMGAHILVRYLAHQDRLFRRVVLTAPMIDIYTNIFPVAFARLLARAATRLGRSHAYALGEGDYRPPSLHTFRKNRLTTDYERYMSIHRRIERNPGLALGGVTYGWLQATFESIDAMAAPGFGRSIRTPVLMVSSGDDQVVPAGPQLTLCRGLEDCHFVSISGARHEILMEQDQYRDAFWRAFDRFMAPEALVDGSAGLLQSASMASSASHRE
jgi:lysophospholipase